MNFNILLTESEKSDYDHEPLGGAVLVRLQAAMGAQGVWRGPYAACTLRPYLEARHRAL